MVVEKEILEWLNRQSAEREVRREALLRYSNAERQKLLVVRRTVQGDIRFEGPDVPKNVKDTVNYMYKVNIPEPARKEKTRYILIDDFRAEKYEKQIETISRQWNVEFITELGNKQPNEVVVLVDPEDIDRVDKGFKLYLPLIYMEKSLILAAELATTDTELKDTQAFRFVKGFYENLLGGAIADNEAILWFKTPWLLKDKLKSLTEELRFLRIATSQLDSSA